MTATIRDVFITLACVVVMLIIPLIFGALDRQADAVNRIALAQEAIAAKPDRSPQLNAECHETLGLFDEWLRHDLRTGGSGRTLK